ncbi:MAG: hypothetical protein OHK0048_16860 [Rhodoferax sp.]
MQDPASAAQAGPAPTPAPIPAELADFYRLVIDRTADGFFRIDAQHRFVDVNDRLCELFGYPREYWMGRTPLDFITPESRAALVAQMQRIASTERRRYQLVGLRADGSTFDILLNTTTHRGADGAVLGSFGFITDISAVVQAQRALAESERELRAILDNLQDTYYRTDAQGVLVRVSPSVQTLLGYAPDEVLGRPLADLYWDPAERAVFLQRLADSGGAIMGAEGRLRHRDGRCVIVTTNAHVLSDDQGQMLGVEGTARDVTAERLAQQKIDFLAHHDALTELPNRLLVKDRFEQSVAQAKRSGARVALVFVDLDRFKAVNDSYGHPVGDALLHEVAQRLRGCVRASDTVGRQGGDEFLLVLPGLTELAVVQRVGDAVLSRLAQPFVVEGVQAEISASLGAAIYPDDGADFETLLRKADLAVYHVKHAGRNALRFYSAFMNDDAHERMALQQDLLHALKRGEFALAYQPLVDLASGAWVGAEALLRWRSPTRGVVSPAVFIPAAEESGLIVPLGRWVLQQACQELARWRAQGHADWRMAVNISAIQMRRGGLEHDVAQALVEANLPASALELELTESVLMLDTDAALATIQSLKARGLRLSIDDFGTGFSSLAYLKRLAVDQLKIDQSFVRHLLADGNDAAIVRAVIQMGQSLGLEVLAEGVEDAATADRLRALGCNLAQGYYFGYPMPGADWLAGALANRTGAPGGDAAARING